MNQLEGIHGASFEADHEDNGDGACRHERGTRCLSLKDLCLEENLQVILASESLADVR